MSSSLPDTPVSTTAASPPRISTYADTNPRLTRCHVTPSPEGDGGLEADGLALPDGPPGDDPAGVADGASEADGAAVPLPAGAHPAIPTIAMAAVPRPRSTRNDRRDTDCGPGIIARWYDRPA